MLALLVLVVLLEVFPQMHHAQLVLVLVQFPELLIPVQHLDLTHPYFP
jgi:hypothetical protein